MTADDKTTRWGTEGEGLMNARYRELYWEVNEYQLILPDSPDPDYVQNRIRKLEAVMRSLEQELGYTPAT